MKVGMVSVWDKWGMCHATTILQLDDCRVVQVKKMETDGYTALQLGVGEAKAKRVKEPMLSHMKRWGDMPAKRKLAEFRVTPDALLETGTLIQAMHFVPGQVRATFPFHISSCVATKCTLLDVCLNPYLYLLSATTHLTADRRMRH